jgi:hypothetical protein
MFKLLLIALCVLLFAAPADGVLGTINEHLGNSREILFALLITLAIQPWLSRQFD